jgi:Rrf2 family protein
MRLSTRGRYGTRALLDIALNQGEAPVSLKDIARRQTISIHYLEHLIAPLIKGGILKSSRGVGGGVALARPASEIRLDEVIELLEGPLSLTDCAGDPAQCGRSAFCATHDLWTELSAAIDGVLESMTLQDLAERQKTKAPPIPLIEG